MVNIFSEASKWQSTTGVRGVIVATTNAAISNLVNIVVPCISSRCWPVDVESKAQLASCIESMFSKPCGSQTRGVRFFDCVLIALLRAQECTDMPQAGMWHMVDGRIDGWVIVCGDTPTMQSFIHRICQPWCGERLR